MNVDAKMVSPAVVGSMTPGGRTTFHEEGSNCRMSCSRAEGSGTDRVFKRGAAAPLLACAAAPWSSRRLVRHYYAPLARAGRSVSSRSSTSASTTNQVNGPIISSHACVPEYTQTFGFGLNLFLDELS